MKVGPTTNAAESCPAASEVREALVGRGDEQRLARIEEHLASCAACGELASTVAEPDDASDAMLHALSSLPIAAEDEPEFRRLQSTLLTMSPPAGPGAGARRLADPPLGELPQTLGHYELLACVGRGAWGAIYRARHWKLEQIVAVKVLDSTRLHLAPAMDRFLQEMKAAGQLKHPNIVQATDAGEDRGFHFLVMEYLYGVDAARLLQLESRLAVADCCEIVRQAAVALDFAHRQSWIHRDVKPSNLMITTAGQVKLLDLGIAGRRDVHPTAPEEQTPLGTAPYMAPEQWKSFATVDARADIYSLGCTLLKLLTGSLPDVSASHETEGAAPPNPAASIAIARADVRRGLDRILRKMLAAEREDRYQSAAEVAAALKPWTRGADLRSLVRRACGGEDVLQSQLPAPEELAERPPAPPIRRRALVGGIAAIAAAGVLTPWLMGWRRPRLRRSEWRPLDLDPQQLLLRQGAADRAELALGNKGQLRARSELAMLIGLGRAVVGPFAVRVSIAQEAAAGAAGLFFRWRRVREFPQLVEFQTIEAAHELHRDQLGPRRLVWRRWNVSRDSGQLQWEYEALAETNVEIAGGADPRCLQVAFGRRSAPEVRYGGQDLAANAWTLSTEGRRMANLEPSRLAYEFLGGVGLINVGGAATFESPELAYL